MELASVFIRHVLYATDNSEDARCAFGYAAAVAKQFDAKLTLLHVIPEFKDMVAFDFGIERSVAAQKWFSVNKDFYEEVRLRLMEIANSTYDGKKLALEDVVLEKGNPAKMILQVAEEKECDLIVMGIKGGGVVDEMIGGTVRGVMRRAKIPVMVMRHQA